MTFKNFKSAKIYLESLIPVGAKPAPGLDRIKALLDIMGNPQNSYPTVHVGGTAGKGSTTTIIAAILEQSGYKTGLHLSPHIEDVRERAQVDGRFMSKAEFIRLVNYIKPYIEQTSKIYSYGMPTYFEALLALAFQHFKDSKVDVAVIEVGLGGTFDGTNVIYPKVAVLTNVGLDHTEILGKTIMAIAKDKIGIFKKGIEIVSGVTQPSVVKLVKASARYNNCRLDILGRDITYDIKRFDLKGTVFDLRFNDLSIFNITTSLLGEHQVVNAAVAIDAALKLNKYGFCIEEKSIRSALRSISIPGRFEVVKKGPIVVLDGAHNPMKIGVLITALKQYYTGRNISIVFAVKKDKNAMKMLKLLSRISKTVYLTKFEAITDFGQRMSMDPKSIPRISGVKYEVLENADDAYRKAIKNSRKNDVICVTGSLFLVGEIRTLIQRYGNKTW